MMFQDDLPSKKPRKPPTTFDFVNNGSSRCFLDIRELALVFNLRELLINVTQTIPRSLLEPIRSTDRYGNI